MTQQSRNTRECKPHSEKHSSHERLTRNHSELTGIEGRLQNSHLVHPSSLDLLHTLSHNEGNLGALSPASGGLVLLKGPHFLYAAHSQ
uniref:Uncharacterized protein n=1 Tax=Cyclopterus lumpus TaxID=8103 RepID=A0A8C3A4G7_CYCLU